VKGNWDGSNEDWNAFVWQAAGRKVGNCAIWLWKYKNNIRFDIRRGGNNYVVKSMKDWGANEWHHVVAVFDCASGIKLYLDGKLAHAKEFTWEPRKHGGFYVGARDSMRYPADAVMDDLKIYNAPLSDAEVALAYEGKLEVARAKPKPPPKAYVPDTTPPKLIFHVPFEDSFDASVAAGEGKPVKAEKVSFTDGIVGRAGEFDKGNKLIYSARENLRKKRGSLCFWYRPNYTPDRQTNHCMFRENGPQPAGENAMWFWIWGLRVRFDLRDAGDRYALRGMSDWKPGTWHFLAVTWECGVSRKVFVDGDYARSTGDSAKGFGALNWETKEYDEFFVGSNGRGVVADGAIDEFKIYDRPLSAEELNKEYLLRFPISVRARHVYFLEGTKAACRWDLRNDAHVPIEGVLSWSLTDAGGKRLAAEEGCAMEFKPGQVQTRSAEVTPTATGQLLLKCTWENADGGFRFDRDLSFWVVPKETPRRGGELKLKLIREIDCTKALGKEEFVGDGQSRVVDAPFGKYREAGPKRHSRFAYRILTPKVGAPHMLTWEYPDDKARTMDVILQTTGKNSGMYDLQTGAFCGGEYPLSNRMLTHKAVFWPRQEDQALIFMTAEDERPAAVAKIKLYEIEGRLPALPVNAAPPRDGWERTVGIYYEDPVLAKNFGGEDMMPGFIDVADRLLDYMDYFGQNILMYPGVWYRGPFFPCRTEQRMDHEHGRPHPTNYIEYLCLRMGQRGMYFIPTFNVHCLPSLTEQVVFDEKEIQAGRETVLMMMWDNRPKTFGWHGTPPNFNPISPEAKRQFTAVIDDMLDLYGDLPAFKGICFHLTQHNILWFGHLDAGYNDCNIEAFQKETGTTIPVDAKDPLRFNKRYRWLMEHAKEKWIDWRCRKIHEYYSDLAERLVKRRADLRLVLNLYIPSSPDEKLSMFKEVKGKDVFREVNRRAGVDIAMFKDDPRIVIQRTLFPADYRWTRAHRRIKGPDVEISRQVNFVDAGFAPLRRCRDVWINYHDRYWEDAVGRNKPLKGLWGGEMGWRVSTLNPNVDHCMEFHAWPLASVDAFAFTKGGFVIGTIGMEEKLGEFAQSFRALPAVKFADVPGLFDPVSVRQYRDGDRLYFYLVNRLSCPVKVQLNLTGRQGPLRNLRTGETQACAAVGGDVQLRLTIAPYGLESFVAESKDLSIRGGRAEVPQSVVKRLQDRLAQLEAKAKTHRPDPKRPIDFAAYFAEARELLATGWYGHLHFLLEDRRARTLDAAE